MQTETTLIEQVRAAIRDRSGTSATIVRARGQAEYTTAFGRLLKDAAVVECSSVFTYMLSGRRGGARLAAGHFPFTHAPFQGQLFFEGKTPGLALNLPAVSTPEPPVADLEAGNVREAGSRPGVIRQDSPAYKPDLTRHELVLCRRAGLLVAPEERARRETFLPDHIADQIQEASDVLHVSPFVEADKRNAPGTELRLPWFAWFVPIRDDGSVCTLEDGGVPAVANSTVSGDDDAICARIDAHLPLLSAALFAVMAHNCVTIPTGELVGDDPDSATDEGFRFGSGLARLLRLPDVSTTDPEANAASYRLDMDRLADTLDEELGADTDHFPPLAAALHERQSNFWTEL